MQVQTAKRTGKHIYAIVRADEIRDFSAEGINRSEVFEIRNNDLAAIVSDVPDGKVRPERRHLAAHSAVLKSLLEFTTPLPVVFGVVADSEEAVHRLLKRNSEQLNEALEELQGKVEMSLRLRWDVPNIFEFFVGKYEAMRYLRDRIVQTGGTQDEKIQLGRLFEAALNSEREQYAENVVEILGEVCVETKFALLRKEEEALNLLCLVEKSKLADFEKAVEIAAADYDDNFAFEYNGPWSPHNFAKFELKI